MTAPAAKRTSVAHDVARMMVAALAGAVTFYLVASLFDERLMDDRGSVAAVLPWLGVFGITAWHGFRGAPRWALRVRLICAVLLVAGLFLPLAVSSVR